MEKTARIRSDTVISDLTLNESTILAALKALEVGKATGPDEIPAKLLKETASVIAPSLCSAIIGLLLPYVQQITATRVSPE